MKILALDLAKFKTVACDYNTEMLKHEFETIATSKEELTELLQTRRPDRVVIEICPMAGWICDLVRGMGIEVEVANTNSEAWRWRNVKRKSDRRDALKLAHKSALEELTFVYVPEIEVREWRALMKYRQQLRYRCTKVKNHIRDLFVRQAICIPRGKRLWTQEGLEQLQKWARPLSKVGLKELWRGELTIELQALKQSSRLLAQVEKKLNQLGKANERVQLLQSAAGVGPRLSEAIVAAIDDPGRFHSGKEVGPYLGLVPKQWQSGESDRLGHISRHGNKLLRALLVEASWVGLRYNPWMRAVYQRVKRGSRARRKIAIIAVARRLLIRCWAMLRDGTRWRGPIATAAAP